MGKERVITYVDEMGILETKSVAECFCKCANEKIIPFLLRYNVPITLESVEGVQMVSKDILRAVREEKERTLAPDFIARPFAEREKWANDQVRGQGCNYYSDNEISRIIRFLVIDGARLMVNDEAIREHFSNYAEGERAVKAYELHKAAVNALNAYFGTRGKFDGWVNHFGISPDGAFCLPSSSIDYGVVSEWQSNRP